MLAGSFLDHCGGHCEGHCEGHCGGHCEDLHTWMLIVGQAVLLGGVDSNFFFFFNFVTVVGNCIYHQTKNLHGATMMCSALCVSAAKS